MNQIEFMLPEIPSEEAMDIASRCWCDKETREVEMDTRLAFAFAKRIDRALKIIDLSARKLVEMDPDFDVNFPTQESGEGK